MNARAMNSAENNNSVFREMYYRLEENREEHPFWLVFILVFVWIVCPIAYLIFVYNVWKRLRGQEVRDEGYESEEEEEEIDEEKI